MLPLPGKSCIEQAQDEKAGRHATAQAERVSNKSRHF